MLNQYLSYKANLKINALKNLRGGKMRQSKGELIENIFRLFVRKTWTEVLGCDPRRLAISRKKIPYSYAPSQHGVLYSKNARLHEKNQGIGLDSFIYVDERLVMGNESKAYCDISMYKRAHGEFESLVALDPSVGLVVFQAENALGGKIHEKTVCNIETDEHLLSKGLIQYLENRRRICKMSPSPTVLTLTENRRSSKNEISLRQNPVTEDRVSECVEFIKKTLGAYA